jgi:hypothetical protein
MTPPPENKTESDDYANNRMKTKLCEAFENEHDSNDFKSLVIVVEEFILI